MHARGGGDADEPFLGLVAESPPRAGPTCNRARRERAGGERATRFARMWEISQETCVAAAHQLRFAPGEGERLHGHNWRIKAVVKAKELHKSGIKIKRNAFERRLDRARIPHVKVGGRRFIHDDVLKELVDKEVALRRD